jgi:hypothetical protein
LDPFSQDFNAFNDPGNFTGYPGMDPSQFGQFADPGNQGVGSPWAAQQPGALQQAGNAGDQLGGDQTQQQPQQQQQQNPTQQQMPNWFQQLSRNLNPVSSANAAQAFTTGGGAGANFGDRFSPTGVTQQGAQNIAAPPPTQTYPPSTYQQGVDMLKQGQGYPIGAGATQNPQTGTADVPLPQADPRGPQQTASQDGGLSGGASPDATPIKTTTPMTGDTSDPSTGDTSDPTKQQPGQQGQQGQRGGGQRDPIQQILRQLFGMNPQLANLAAQAMRRGMFPGRGRFPFRGGFPGMRFPMMGRGRGRGGMRGGFPGMMRGGFPGMHRGMSPWMHGRPDMFGNRGMIGMPSGGAAAGLPPTPGQAPDTTTSTDGTQPDQTGTNQQQQWPVDPQSGERVNPNQAWNQNAQANAAFGVTPSGRGATGAAMSNISLPGGGNVRVASDFAPTASGFLRDLAAAGAPLTDVGGYNFRNIAGTGQLSQHAFGHAMDINQTGRNQVSPAFAQWARQNQQTLRNLINKWGLVSGGDWRNPDFGHFEMRRRQLAMDNPSQAYLHGVG